jgi:hypothetical protein
VPDRRDEKPTVVQFAINALKTVMAAKAATQASQFRPQIKNLGNLLLSLDLLGSHGWFGSIVAWVAAFAAMTKIFRVLNMFSTSTQPLPGLDVA